MSWGQLHRADGAEHRRGSSEAQHTPPPPRPSCLGIQDTHLPPHTHHCNLGFRTDARVRAHTHIHTPIHLTTHPAASWDHSVTQDRTVTL